MNDKPLFILGALMLSLSLSGQAHAADALQDRYVQIVCLAAGVSGGLKSHSVRGPGPISEGGGNASPARVDGRYGEASEARRRKPRHG